MGNHFTIFIVIYYSWNVEKESLYQMVVKPLYYHMSIEVIFLYKPYTNSLMVTFLLIKKYIEMVCSLLLHL